MEADQKNRSIDSLGIVPSTFGQEMRRHLSDIQPDHSAYAALKAIVLAGIDQGVGIDSMVKYFSDEKDIKLQMAEDVNSLFDSLLRSYSNPALPEISASTLEKVARDISVYFLSDQEGAFYDYFVRHDDYNPATNVMSNEVISLFFSEEFRRVLTDAFIELATFYIHHEFTKLMQKSEQREKYFTHFFEGLLSAEKDEVSAIELDKKWLMLGEDARAHGVTEEVFMALLEKVKMPSERRRRIHEIMGRFWKKRIPAVKLKMPIPPGSPPSNYLVACVRSNDDQKDQIAHGKSGLLKIMHAVHGLLSPLELNSMLYSKKRSVDDITEKTKEDVGLAVNELLYDIPAAANIGEPDLIRFPRLVFNRALMTGCSIEGVRDALVKKGYTREQLNRAAGEAMKNQRFKYEGTET